MIFENVNPIKLAQELWDNGIVTTNVSNDLVYVDGVPISLIGTLNVDFADGTDMFSVQTIVDTHDPLPVTKPLTTEERIEELEQIVNLLLIGGI